MKVIAYLLLQRSDCTSAALGPVPWAFLEAECGLQVNTAVRRRVVERPGSQPVRDIEETGSQNAAWIRQVHLVKNVPYRSANGEIVTAVGSATEAHGATASEQWPAASTTAAAPTASGTAAGAATLTLIASTFAYSWTEAEALGQAEIQGRVARAGTVVDRNRSVGSGTGIGIEIS